MINTTLLDMVLRLLADEVIEVRQVARKTLTNMIAWDVISVERKKQLIEHFKTQIIESVNNKIYNQNLLELEFKSPKGVVMKHSAVLGLCAFVLAYPNSLPRFLPDIILFLCQYINEPQQVVQVNIIIINQIKLIKISAFIYICSTQLNSTHIHRNQLMNH